VHELVHEAVFLVDVVGIEFGIVRLAGVHARG
jgi:hypothetical protein